MNQNLVGALLYIDASDKNRPETIFCKNDAELMTN